MRIPSAAPADFTGHRLRLSTLVGLRWLAVAGQTLAVIVVGFWFGFPVPFGACFALIAAAAWINIALRLILPGAYRVDPGWATVLLAFDVLQLSGLLYLTGGLQNPFAILLIGPVMVSATTLQPDKTFLLGGLSLAAATILIFIHLPLPWFPDQDFDAPIHYVGGVWVAIVCALSFMAFYGFRVAEEARQLANALAATELVLQREQHLSALDGLAAAAAHELGTPLATIALVANELVREMAPDDPRLDDIQLLKLQAQRCRDILAKITSLSSAPEEHLGSMPLSHILEEVSAPHRDFGIAIEIGRDGAGAEPVAPRNPGLVYGIGNLVENAVDFARSRVVISAVWSEEEVRVVIADDGPGFAADVIDRLGDPYVTTRRFDGAAVEGGGGMGLGFFIAKTLLERTGASLSLGHRRSPERGAVVTIIWPREAFEGTREPLASVGYQSPREGLIAAG